MYTSRRQNKQKTKGTSFQDVKKKVNRKSPPRKQKETGSPGKAISLFKWRRTLTQRSQTGGNTKKTDQKLCDTAGRLYQRVGSKGRGDLTGVETLYEAQKKRAPTQVEDLLPNISASRRGGNNKKTKWVRKNEWGA